jgi:hypothetical protein
VVVVAAVGEAVAVEDLGAAWEVGLEAYFTLVEEMPRIMVMYPITAEVSLAGDHTAQTFTAGDFTAVGMADLARITADGPVSIWE